MTATKQPPQSGLNIPPWGVRFMAGTLSFVVLFLLAAIPWGVTMERRTAEMQRDIKYMSEREVPPKWFRDKVDDLEARVRLLERANK